MRILGIAAFMPPAHWAGSEVALHTLLTELHSRGHEVRSIVQQGGGRHGVVTSTRMRSRTATTEAAKWADIVIGQQSAQHVAVAAAAAADRPALVWAHTWPHNRSLPPVVDPTAIDAGAAVYANSEAAATAIRLAYPGVDARVLRPLVHPADYKTERPGAEHVGLVNLSALKGGHLFHQLSVACPKRLFLGRHGWGRPYRGAWADNVTVQQRAADMQPFYSRARVLLMPSEMESWGRVGAEAAASGIPVIGHPTPGLTEALGDSAVWVDRDDLDGWINALDALDDTETYAELSASATTRAAELETLAMDDITRLEQHAEELTRRPKTPAKKAAAVKKAAAPKGRDNIDLARVAVLVPWKPGDPARDEAWKHVRSHWDGDFPNWPLIQGLHDVEPFNRSRALNVAADIAGPHDVFIIADADTLCDGQQVMAAVKTAHRTGRITFAHSEFRALNRRGTRMILDGYKGSWDKFVEWRMRDTASSCVAVPWALWDKVGGFDERFTGWGYEDVAFSLACQVLGGGFERIAGPVWHLHHPKSPTNRPGSATYTANIDLCQLYIDAYDPPDAAAMTALTDEARLVAVQ